MSDYNKKGGEKKYVPEVKVARFTRFSLDTTFDLEDGSTTKPSIIFTYRGKYPRFTVFTRSTVKDPETGKTDYSKIITAPFHGFMLILFLRRALSTIRKKEKGKYRDAKCFNIKWKDGEKTDEKYLQATVRIGIDDKGVAYIKVIDAGKDDIEFPFTPDQTVWVGITDDDGDEIISKPALSRAFAEIWLESLISAVRKEIIEDVEYSGIVSKIPKDKEVTRSNVKDNHAGATGESRATTADDILDGF